MKILYFSKFKSLSESATMGDLLIRRKHHVFLRLIKITWIFPECETRLLQSNMCDYCATKIKQIGHSRLRLSKFLFDYCS